MKSLILKTAFSLVVMLGLLAPTIPISTNSVLAVDTKSVCEGIGAVGGDSSCGTTKTAAECKNNPNAAGCEVNSAVVNIINLISWAAGIVAVIMVMLGGFWYITSNGDAAKATRGRTTIMYALIGLVIVALAQVIVRFVIGLIAK